MYRELAVIKDIDTVTGFVVYDGLSTKIIDIDEAKQIAADGYMDTLKFEDGRFIPIVQGELADELKRKFCLKNHKKCLASMTFSDFVANDCIFKKPAVDLMMKREDVILANVCLVLEIRIGNLSESTMVVSFWSSHKQAADQLRDALSTYAPYIKTIYKAHDYDGFITLNLPLTNPKCNFDLLKLQQKTGLQFLYNIDMMNNMKDRVALMLQSMPYLMKKMMSKAMPTNNAIARITDVLWEANHRLITDTLKN